ncbi:hypothetical protein PSPO01_07153 [Paraphaeosphaeria sporulosa]
MRPPFSGGRVASRGDAVRDERMRATGQVLGSPDDNEGKKWVKGGTESALWATRGCARADSWSAALAEGVFLEKEGRYVLISTVAPLSLRLPLAGTQATAAEGAEHRVQEPSTELPRSGQSIAPAAPLIPGPASTTRLHVFSRTQGMPPTGVTKFSMFAAAIPQSHHCVVSRMPVYVGVHVARIVGAPETSGDRAFRDTSCATNKYGKRVAYYA